MPLRPDGRAVAAPGLTAENLPLRPDGREVFTPGLTAEKFSPPA
jgi:hypothetical protein